MIAGKRRRRSGLVRRAGSRSRSACPRPCVIEFVIPIFPRVGLGGGGRDSACGRGLTPNLKTEVRTRRKPRWTANKGCPQNIDSHPSNY
eukprot:7390311-Prymnesium_polylepis.1